MYIYAPSYQSLLFAFENFPVDELKIITRHAAVHSFASKMKIPCTFMEYEKDYSRKSLYEYRDSLQKIRENIKSEDIIYCFYLSAMIDYFVVQQLSKSNNIFFHNRDPKFNRIKIHQFGLIFTKDFLMKLYNKLIYKIIFNINSNIIYGDNRYWLGILNPIGKKFIPNNRGLFKENTYSIIKSYGIPQYDVIFINNIHHHLKADIKKLVNMLNKLSFFGLSVAVKLHPKEPQDYFNSFTVLPSDIPAEFLSACTKKAIIGISSISLKKLSEYTNVYSLIEIINNDHGDWKKGYTKFLLDKNIRIPSNEKELIDSILNS